MQPSDLVLRFVSSTGQAKEAQLYLSLFRADRPESFAIIAVSDAVMRTAAGALVMDLRFLAELGLTPVVQFGVLDSGDASAPALYVARHLKPDVRAEITTTQGARELARAGIIPLIPPIFPGDGGEPGVDRPLTGPDITPDAVRDARFDGLARLSTVLGTRKVIFLGRQSGLAPEDGPVRSLVDLTTEYEALMSSLPADEAELLRQAHRLIDAVPHRLSVTITSPLDLLRELFTTRGAGTLIRRGAVVTRHSDFSAISLPKLRDLIESAFHRRLVHGFFDRPIASVYLADDYRGVGIVSETEQGPYLSKFAVDRRAQGEGVGRDLWRALVRDHQTLLWRSRPDNPIAAWYQQQCDGMVRAGIWLVFWRGLPHTRLSAAIELALAAPPDFE